MRCGIWKCPAISRTVYRYAHVASPPHLAFSLTISRDTGQQWQRQNGMCVCGADAWPIAEAGELNTLQFENVPLQLTRIAWLASVQAFAI